MLRWLFRRATRLAQAQLLRTLLKKMAEFLAKVSIRNSNSPFPATDIKRSGPYSISDVKLRPTTQFALSLQMPIGKRISGLFHYTKSFFPSRALYSNIFIVVKSYFPN